MYELSNYQTFKEQTCTIVLVHVTVSAFSEFQWHRKKFKDTTQIFSNHKQVTCLSYVPYAAKNKLCLYILVCLMYKPLYVRQRNIEEKYTLGTKITETQHFSSIPSLPVANDQFSLSSTNRHQRIHSLDTCLHGLPHRYSGNDTRCLHTNSSPNKNT